MNFHERGIFRASRFFQQTHQQFDANIMRARFVSSFNDFDIANNDDIDDDSDGKCSLRSNQNQFQDLRIGLSCIGECNSDIAKFLVDESNLKHFIMNQTPRSYHVPHNSWDSSQNLVRKIDIQ